MKLKVSKDLPCLVKTPFKPKTTWKGLTSKFFSEPKLGLFFDLFHLEYNDRKGCSSKKSTHLE
jgi:hypothetical protein